MQEGMSHLAKHVLVQYKTLLGTVLFNKLHSRAQWKEVSVQKCMPDVLTRDQCLFEITIVPTPHDGYSYLVSREK